MKLVDTHTHLFVSEFEQDRDAVIKRAIEAGVTKLCLPCITPNSIELINTMCIKYPEVCYPMLGLHPTEVNKDYKELLQKIQKELDKNKNIIAIGEIGIDLYWDDSFKKEQIETFETQITWAKEKSLPLSIHSRNAFNVLYESMIHCKCNELQGVFHCFTGTKEELKTLLSFEGFMFGIGGVVTYKNSNLPDVLADMPIERIVLETDSPYLPPVPHRGKRNESSYITFIVKRLAEIYDKTEEEIASITTSNAKKLFAI